MQNDNINKDIKFDYSESTEKPIIKVVGVGGGGGNAVNNMFLSGKVRNVTFLLCNTDAQALSKSDIPDKLVLGEEVTMGLGAGNRPERAREAAMRTEPEIRQRLKSDGTQMVFLTAGMGGGTGTGAAPVIGRCAMDEGLLTIAIVTIPFLFEGRHKILQALQGVKELKENVDAMLVVNNERLKIIYPDLAVRNALDIADETLLNAAMGISEMIVTHGRINLDFADVKTTLKDGGVAIISTGYGSGENRLEKAIEQALNSPLLNNNNIYRARRVLMNIYDSKTDPLKTNELEGLHAFTAKIETQYEAIWGFSENKLETDEVGFTILATGFDLETTTQSIEGIDSDRKPGFLDAESQGEVERVDQENKLIGTYYGSNTLERKVYKPVALMIEELDDDDVISIMEDTPTLNRNNNPIEEVRKRKNRATVADGKAKEEVKNVSSQESKSGSDLSSPFGNKVIRF